MYIDRNYVIRHLFKVTIVIIGVKVLLLRNLYFLFKYNLLMHVFESEIIKKKKSPAALLPRNAYALFQSDPLKKKVKCRSETCGKDDGV